MNNPALNPNLPHIGYLTAEPCPTMLNPPPALPGSPTPYMRPAWVTILVGYQHCPDPDCHNCALHVLDAPSLRDAWAYLREITPHVEAPPGGP